LGASCYNYLSCAVKDVAARATVKLGISRHLVCLAAAIQSSGCKQQLFISSARPLQAKRSVDVMIAQQIPSV